MLLDEEGIPRVVQNVKVFAGGELYVTLFDGRKVMVWRYQIKKHIPTGLSEQLYNDWFDMELEKYCLMKYFPNKEEADESNSTST